MLAPLASALGSGAQGLVGIASGMIGSGARQREQRSAQGEYDRNMARFNNLDTSNIYANQQNMYEDSIVNQKEAEFTRAQNMQSQANIMGSMNQAAGGSGIAAMAQALANEATSAAQSASVSIGNQEAANQSNFQAAATNIQNQKLAGEESSREAEREKTTTLLGMSQNRLGAANAARAAATSAIVGGVGTMMGGAEKFLGK